MSHLHHHEHRQHLEQASTGDLRLAFALNLGFTLLELFGGLWTNSVAILSDAVHDLGDSLAIGTAWYLEKISRRSSDRRFSYGYRRFSLLGALINTVVLIVGSVLVLSEAIPRLLNPESPNAAGMIVFALGGILANGLAVLRLRGGKSLNARVVAWHLLEDVLGWTAVLIVSLILLLWDVPILDPILSILITLYILYNVIQNLRRTLRLFLQAVPEGMELEQIENRLLALEPVCSIHHTHVWSLDGEHHVLTTHVVVEEGTSRKTIQELKRSIHALSAEYDLVHTTVEVEYADEDCGMISHSERLEATQET